MGTIADKLTYLKETKTAIEVAIIAKGVSVSDSDTFRSYAAKIRQISGGGTSTTRFGVTLDAFLGDVIDGVLYESAWQGPLDFSEVREIAPHGLSGAFVSNGRINGVNLSTIETIGMYGLYEAFESTHIQGGVDLSSLTVLYDYGMYAAFKLCTEITSANLSSLTEIPANGMQQTFYACSVLTSVNLDSLTAVSENGLSGAFQTSGLTSISLGSLKTVGNGGLNSMCNGCSSLKTADFRALESVNENGMNNAFNNCKLLSSVNLSSLTEIGFLALRTTFSSCEALTTISFPSLTIIDASGLGSSNSTAPFRNCTGLTEIHFRSDVQATIEGTVQYTNKFGATNATIYFDLIGTITVNGVAYSRSEPNSIYADSAKTYIAWKDASDNIVYTSATAEPAVGTVVYSDQGTTQVGTVEGVA